MNFATNFQLFFTVTKCYVQSNIAYIQHVMMLLCAFAYTFIMTHHNAKITNNRRVRFFSGFNAKIQKGVLQPKGITASQLFTFATFPMLTIRRKSQRKIRKFSRICYFELCFYQTLFWKDLSQKSVLQGKKYLQIIVNN